MAIAYTKKMFIERVRRHMANGWPNSDFAVSENEVLLYIDSAIAQRIVGHAYDSAKIHGVLEVPEAFMITYALSTPTYDPSTNDYTVALPQPPLSLPLGYSIQSLYFGGKQGRSIDVRLVKGKRTGYRNLLPAPDAVFARVEGNYLKLWTSNGQPLSPATNTLYVTMPSARTQNVTDPMDMPDDDMAFVFDYVVKQLIQRLGIPKDIIQDDLTAGNKQ